MHVDLNDVAELLALVWRFEKEMSSKLRFSQCSAVPSRRRQAVSHGCPEGRRHTVDCMSYVARRSARVRARGNGTEDDDDFQARWFDVFDPMFCGSFWWLDSGRRGPRDRQTDLGSTVHQDCFGIGSKRWATGIDQVRFTVQKVKM